MREIVEKGRAPIKMWTDGVEVEHEALNQLRNTAALPFIFRHLAVMPDVHWGMGATIGSVVATVGAIVPAAVGVDIGCGMVAARTPLTASDLPESLKTMRADIEWGVPVGFGAHREDRAPFGEWAGGVNPLAAGYAAIHQKHPLAVRSRRQTPLCQLGTLGGGNHFVEVCLDEEQRVWVMLHSGSRGVGNGIGQYFIDKAKEYVATHPLEMAFATLPQAAAGLPQGHDPNLSWLSRGTPLYDDYVEAVGWAQRYAATNREVMLRAVLAAVQKHTFAFAPSGSAPYWASGLGACEVVVNCHHNYVAEEVHFGERVLVTRKGAVRAGLGDLGIIPGSMGARSYIVRGRGNPESFQSCSHGAGRRMSRGRAKREFTVADHEAATAGVECRKDAGVLDETPAAYKDIDAVMAAQADLVDVVHVLKGVLCVKG